MNIDVMVDARKALSLAALEDELSERKTEVIWSRMNVTIVTPLLVHQL